MSKLVTDVVVVGGELCGLAAAAVIAHGHKNVVVLGDGEPPDVLPLGDRLAPVAPTLWRFPAGGPGAALVDGLGLKQDARRVLGDPVGLGIVDDPDVRMQVEFASPAREAELGRVFGEAGAKVAALLHELPLDQRHKLLLEAGLLHQEGFFEKRRAKKRQALLGAAGSFDAPDPATSSLVDTGLGAALPYIVPFVQGLGTSSVQGLGGYLAAIPLAAGAQPSARGGLGPRHAMKELLRGVIRGHGGDILERERVVNVHVDGKSVLRIETSGANDYQAKAIIDATSRRDFTERIPAGRRRDKMLAAEAAIPVVSEAIVVRWLVHVSAVPRGMPPLLLALPQDPAGTAVLVGTFAGLPPKEGNKTAAVDDPLVAVVAMTLCQVGPVQDAERAAELLDQRLGELMPFARQHIKATDRLCGPQAQGIHPLYAAVLKPEHILLGRRPGTGFVNVFRAGRDLAPPLGVDGELVAAKSVAASVQAAMGVKADAATEAA